MTPAENHKLSEKSLPASLPTFKKYSDQEFRTLLRKTKEDLDAMRAEGMQDRGYPRNYAGPTPTPTATPTENTSDEKTTSGE